MMRSYASSQKCLLSVVQPTTYEAKIPADALVGIDDELKS